MFKSRPETIFSIIALIVGIVVLILGAHQKDTYIQSLYANGGVTFIGLAVALWIVNIYLDRRSRNAAKHALFELVGESLSDINNKFLRCAHDYYGSPKLDELTDTFQKNERSATALSLNQRAELWRLLQNNSTTLDPLLQRLDGELKELCNLVGWSFDPRLLYLAVSCRTAIAQYTRTKSGTSDDDIKLGCENFLETILLNSELFKEIDPRR
jgi:hypothetical protein